MVTSRGQVSEYDMNYAKWVDLLDSRGIHITEISYVVKISEWEQKLAQISLLQHVECEDRLVN